MRPPKSDDAERILCERWLSEYFRFAWQVLNPSTELIPGWHIDAICERLEAVSAGEIKRLIVNIPPRYTKSTAVSIMWPTWTWIERPEMRWIFVSFSQTLSTKHSIDRRTVLQSDWYRGHWADRFRLASDQNVKTEFLNDKRGHMLATSIGGTVTGKGGDVVVIDDPHDPEKAYSDTERQKALRVFDQTLTTRLDDKRTGAMVVIMQRLHEDDLTGHLLASEREWEHLCLPGEYEPSHPFVWPDDPREEPGELLCPEREGPAEIDLAKIDLASFGFAGQYQQRPAPAEGGLFKTAHWRYFPTAYLEPPSPLVFSRIVQSWDTAWKEKQTSDYVCCSVFGVAGANRYLLRRVRERMNVPATKRAIRETFAWVEQTYPRLPHAILVPRTDVGTDILAELRDEIGGLVGVNVQGDKVQRAHAVVGQVESGNVFVPGHPLPDATGPDPARTPGWVMEWIGEHAAFPNAAHDDQVDTTTQALQWLRGVKDNLPSVIDEDERPERSEAVTAGIYERTF